MNLPLRCPRCELPIVYLLCTPLSPCGSTNASEEASSLQEQMTQTERPSPCSGLLPSCTCLMSHRHHPPKHIPNRTKLRTSYVSLPLRFVEALSVGSHEKHIVPCHDHLDTASTKIVPQRSPLGSVARTVPLLVETEKIQLEKVSEMLRSPWLQNGMSSPSLKSSCSGSSFFAVLLPHSWMLSARMSTRLCVLPSFSQRFCLKRP